jgi:hypothetical protein
MKMPGFKAEVCLVRTTLRFSSYHSLRSEAAISNRAPTPTVQPSARDCLNNGGSDLGLTRRA